MASACLPHLFRAVEIEGEAYWDGGYAANPALLPLLRSTDVDDLLIVQINPREHGRPPASAREIMSRASEITFNAALLAELRAIELINGLIDQGRLQHGGERGDYRHTRLHRIVMTDLGETLARPTASSATTSSSSSGCTSSASARRGVSSTTISAISAPVAPSMWRRAVRPRWHDASSGTAPPSWAGVMPDFRQDLRATMRTYNSIMRK